ncbi:MAG: SusD/RagB family nutrient-binding outer membrane lipoprotein, partial [Bacteroidales bacterium]|nr:SusD/RagB family nutrient-binding outer membrane lipoprotein [Bacteroidales bacterium]
SGDIIFSNNKASWIKAANALKARYALYLGEYDNALTYTASAFTANDKFVMTFGTSNTEAGPMYQYATVSSYKNDIKMCSTFIDKLVATTDPRRTFYAKTIGGAYVGSAPGSEETSASGLGTYNNTADAPVVLSSYAEMQFIRAECFLMKPTPDNDAAAAAYKAAVAASVLAVTGNANTAWLDANINAETGATITLEKIIEQKYLAMYSTVVPYDDYRRTGYPALTPVPGAGQIPERFPYPQTEIAYNSFTPVIANTNQKLWIFQ